MEFILDYGLVAVFFALVLTPFGLPIPEEISLIAAGGLAANGNANPIHAWIVGFIGVTGGDLISWTMGRMVGLEPKGFVSRLIGQEQLIEIEQFFRKWDDWAIVIARQIPGMRFPAFFFAGASAVPVVRFYFIDALASMITVNVFFYIGFRFSSNINLILPYVDGFRNTATTTVAVLFLLFVIRIIYRRLKKK